MKKLYLAFIACLLVAATVVMPVGATEDVPAEVTGIDQNLVVHYDFNGDTLEEQMADKAPAGVSKENLSFYTTQDANTQADLSYVADGVAHIDHSTDNYMWVKYDADNNIGTDIANLAEEGAFTVFTAVKVSGSPQAWATFVDMNDVTRMLIKGAAGNNAIYSTMLIRGGTTSYLSSAVEWAPKNGDIFHDTDIVYIAVTYEYDKDTQLLVGTAFHSFDFGKTWTETPGYFENVAEFLPTNTHICLGKTRAGNRFTRFDDGSSFDFYDFRVYNTALNLDQIKTIKTGHEPAEDETPDTNAPDENVTTVPEQEEGTTPPPAENVTTGKGEVTAAPTEGSAAEETDEPSQNTSKGCFAGIGATGAVSVMALLTTAGAVLSKKKKK